MEYIKKPLADKEIANINKKYGGYVKITADIEREELVAGCLLHADGEKILLAKGSKQEFIWGGGINFKTGEIDCLAVLNLRPANGNPGMEIIDPKKREKFIKTVRKIFNSLWEK